MDGLTYKSVGFELQDLKARDDGWSFSGYASTFGNVDEGGDVVIRGAFLDTLSRRTPKLLWQHDVGEPLGKVVSLKEDDRGLYGEFKISRTTRGQDAYQLLKDGAIDSMSIGYIPEDQEFTDDGIRQLKAVELLEISVVSIPMNEEALITSVKAQQPLSVHGSRVLEDMRLFADRYRTLAELRARDGRYPGEEARRVVTELKALAAVLEVPVVSDVTVPAKGLGTTNLRLELARRRLRHAGILERATA